MPRPALVKGQPVAVTLSGGGTRLYGHAGVLSAVEAAGLAVREVMGVSGGALVAAAYACLGMTKTATLLASFDVDQVLRFNWFRNLGYYDNAAIASFCDASGVTWEAAAERGIDLKIGVSVLEPGVQVVWTPEQHPVGMSLGEAVRISSSIPLLWGYTRLPSTAIAIPGLPADAKLPAELTLADGGCSDMLLPGDTLPWIVSNIAFNGYRETTISGLLDYLVQILSSLQYRNIQGVCAGASAVVEHRHMRATGWLDRFTPQEIVQIMLTAKQEAADVLAAAMAP